MTRGARLVARTIAVWAALLPTGCDPTPRTEVIVVADTDLDVPSGLDAVLIEVTSPVGEVQTSQGRLSGPEDLPVTLGLLHESGPLGPFDVRVEGRRSSGLVVERQARFTFVPEETRVLIMHLVESCRHERCPAGQTCTEHGCAPISQAQDDLQRWTGTPPRLDEAPADGDADADEDEDEDVDSDAEGDVEIDADGDTCLPDELCNGFDDDCDGVIDNGFDLDEDEMNCGVCGHVCDFRNGTGECLLGVCVVLSCDDHFDDCNETGDDGCESDLRSTPEHCGECTTACSYPNGIAGCADGVCFFERCQDGFESCNETLEDGCEEDIGTNPLQCGACGHACDFSNGTGECAAGRCTMLTCEGTSGDCNVSGDDGCERDLAIDLEHCGECSHPCDFRNSTGACAEGSCTITSCDTGFGDCNRTGDDGCEIDLNTNDDNCGTCGERCLGTSRVCCAGVCLRPPCP